ncbi:MFS transporter [Bacillus sp. JJ722]|uniref:MFS transporter n=1 Tax=Bacillus sp. JJ722 TaxID=3122973 RepID=UPI002FFFF3D0
MLSKTAQKTTVKLANTTILSNRNFLFLWVASIFSGLSLSIYLLAETWYVLRVLKQPASLGIIMLLTTIPRVLFMFIGGVLADRMKRSNIMFISNGIRGLLVLLMVLLVINDLMTIWSLGVFALLFGVLDAFFWPANQSFIPQIVNKEQLVKANSYIQTTNQLTTIIGPMLAGIVIEFGNFSGVFILTSLLLLISSLLVKQMKEVKADHKKKESTALLELKEGLHYIKGMPFLITFMCISLFTNFFLVGPVNIGLPLLVDQSLQGSVMDLSYLESAFAIGMIIGALLVGFLNIKKRRPIINISLLGILSTATLFLSQMNMVWQGIIILIIVGFCLSISNILSASLVQEMTDPQIIGRVQSLMSTASMGFIPLSLGLVSILIGFGISIQLIIFISTSFLILFTLFILIKVKVIWTVD